MRLLHANGRGELVFEEFMDEENIPPYAILSHTWTGNEISYRDMQAIIDALSRGAKELTLQARVGYWKIIECWRIVQEHHLGYFWIDTCCIDKTSSAELSEAINSMYRWYQNSNMCIVYLEDVSIGVEWQRSLDASHYYFVDPIPSDLRSSRWFKRGWTLQELIAPSDLRFFDRYWTYMFAKKDPWCAMLEKISRVPRTVLLKPTEVSKYSIAQRMCWAAQRKTTRREDIAYCLMGLFEVNMPLLYGEGARAFIRLQEEIIKESSDQSIFAWGSEVAATDQERLTDYGFDRLSGLLAWSPAQFIGSDNVFSQDVARAESRLKYSMSNEGLQMRLPILSLNPTLSLGLLSCCRREWSGFADVRGPIVGIYLTPTESTNSAQYARTRLKRGLISVSKSQANDAVEQTIYVRKHIRPPGTESILRQHSFFVRQLPHIETGFSLETAVPEATWEFRPKSNELHTSRAIRSAALIFQLSNGQRLALLLNVADTETGYEPKCKWITVTSTIDDEDKLLEQLETRDMKPEDYIIRAAGGIGPLTSVVANGRLLGHDVFTIDITAYDSINTARMHLSALIRSARLRPEDDGPYELPA